MNLHSCVNVSLSAAWNQLYQSFGKWLSCSSSLKAAIWSAACIRDESTVCVRAGRVVQGPPWWALHLRPRTGGQRPAEVPWSQGTCWWRRGEGEVQHAEVLQRRAPPPGWQAGGRPGGYWLCANGYVPPLHLGWLSHISWLIFSCLFFCSLKSLQEKWAAGQRRRIFHDHFWSLCRCWSFWQTKWMKYSDFFIHSWTSEHAPPLTMDSNECVKYWLIFAGGLQPLDCYSVG